MYPNVQRVGSSGVMFDDNEGIRVELVTTTFTHSTRHRYYLDVQGLGTIATSCTQGSKLKGSFESFIRARLKARINYLNVKIKGLRRLESELAILENHYNRYRK